MSAPRHLWSGDWERESAAAAEELARRQARTEEPAAAPLPGPAERSTPAAAGRAPAHMRGLRSRGAVVIVLAMLLSGGIAYAAVSALVRNDGGSPARTNGALSASSARSHSSPRSHSSARSHSPAWLGVETMSFPGTAGVMVVNVVPGSPAGVAGLQPGDVITQVGSQPVRSPADLESALAGMHAGQHVEIQYEQGPLSQTTEVTLRSRPANGP